MTVLPLMRLTQGHLNTFARCPRKFQHQYLDQLAATISPDHQAQLEWGKRFHQLMQRHEMGLPIVDQPPEQPELYACWQTFVQSVPELFDAKQGSDNTPLWRQSEHLRLLYLEQAGYTYLFTVVYDLLRLTDNTAEIFDWKTYRHPRSAAALAQDWQTRLYCYVLAETSPYPPEQITMTYWFIQPPQNGGPISEPQAVRLDYSPAMHQQNKQDLLVLTRQMAKYLEQDDFPPIPEALGHCKTCPFALRCQRSSQQLPPWSIEHLLNEWPNWDEVAL